MAFHFAALPAAAQYTARHERRKPRFLPFFHRVIIEDAALCRQLLLSGRAPRLLGNGLRWTKIVCLAILGLYLRFARRRCSSFLGCLVPGMLIVEIVAYYL